MTEHVVPVGERYELVQHDEEVVMHPAWRHSRGRVRTSPEEFLAVSGLAEHERQLLRERYSLSESGRPHNIRD
ncbi:hypothetical protein ABZ897_50115 [Nonomuraea sp. NPDC046802]|uniref:hypothetical protein n=1 Tax=Nonomuraea sp. NPDC046802 TaxID=3154919 RepID=UPI0033C320D1